MDGPADPTYASNRAPERRSRNVRRVADQPYIIVAQILRKKSCCGPMGNRRYPGEDFMNGKAVPSSRRRKAAHGWRRVRATTNFNRQA